MTVSRPRRPASVLSVATAAAVAFALAGCSSESSGTGNPANPTGGGSTSASASPSPSPTDAADLVQDSTDALTAAESFHIEGTLGGGSGLTLDLDITYGAGGTAQGTIDAGDGASVELRKTDDGTVYAKGTADYYANPEVTGDDPDDPDLSSIADKWVVVGDDAPGALDGLDDLLDPGDLASSLEPDDGENYELSGPEDVNGVSSYIVTDEDGATFAIAAEGDPLPVQIKNEGSDDAGEINFDGYGEDLSVDAPDDSEIVEIPA